MSTTHSKHYFVNDTIQDLLAPHAPAAQGQEDGQARPPPRPHAPHVDALGAHGQGPHHPEQEGQGESQHDPLLAQELLRQQQATQAQARQDQEHRRQENMEQANHERRIIINLERPQAEPQMEQDREDHRQRHPNDNRRHKNRARREPQHEPSEHNSGNGNGRHGRNPNRDDHPRHRNRAPGHVMITKAKRTVKLDLHLGLTRPMWMPPVLMAKVHTNPNKKAKESHKMILSLHKNYFDNNMLPKLKPGKTKGTAIKRTWNKQTKSVASSSTVRDLKLNHKWKKIEKITVNATPMTIGATTTAQEENHNMSQVNTTPAMAMADMEEIPIEMTTSDTGIEHPAT